MNRIREKVIQANFTKALKRLIIAALCVVILGGGASAFLLRTQIWRIQSPDLLQRLKQRQVLQGCLAV